jgi:tRNA modification GTPase
MNRTTDTIAAIATPPGRGGIGIVRVSGPATRDIASALLGRLPAPRHATHTLFRDANNHAIDDGIALYFPAPHSFTGEDVLELHGHGGPVVMDMLLTRIVALGARLARPGEFSERAFLNDKLDLAQAEAIADLIDSGSTQAARAALRSLQGEFSQRIHALVETLIELRSYVEASIDFVDEEIDFLSDGKVAERLRALLEQIGAVQQSAQQGRLLRDGMTVVIAGRPNAGKSSLLNRLAGYEAAIVTEIPGTTRDVLREYINIDGMPVHIIDTAGLRDSGDIVEQEGMRRTWDAIAQADRVLLMIDDRLGIHPEDVAILTQLPAELPVTVVRNKIDLTGHSAGENEGPEGPEVCLSAKSGAGIDNLRAHLKTCMGYTGADSGGFLARRRHLDALSRAHAHLVNGQQQLQHAQRSELLAEELRLAQQALAEITGEFGSEDLLTRIFSSFCIGK